MKEINIRNFYSTLTGYFKVQPDWDITLYISLLNVVIVVILIIAISKIFFRNEKKSLFVVKQLSIYFSLVISITLLIFFSVFYTVYESYIYIHNLQSVLILLCIFQIIILISIWNKTIKQIRSNNPLFLGLKLGPNKLHDDNLYLVRYFNNKKMFFIVILIPFLLIFLKPGEKYLYSIVFDNSGSMDVQNTNALKALSEIIDNLKDNSSFVISSIPFCSGENDCIKIIMNIKKNMKSITAVNDTGSLVSNTVVFNNKSELKNYLLSNEIEITSASSPIYECMWDNFSKSLELNVESTFDKKRLIVLTDGMDNLYDPNPEHGFKMPGNCITGYSINNIRMDDFYNRITFIRYFNSNQGVFNTCKDLEIIDGESLAAIKSGFNNELRDIYFDREFLIILFLLIIISFIIFYSIK
jgi:hypothetical protein